MKNYMRQVIKTFLLAGAVMFALLQSAWAYSLGGPIANAPDTWQVDTIGYGEPGDLVAPKNIGEGYRRNTPVMYYAYDANFLGFFGTNGEAAVDAAFTVLTTTFTNNPTGATDGLDGYSTALTEFPLESRHFNYQAQALGLFDLKSTMLGIMMEQLGLADPVRYDWTLREVFLLPNTTCPVGEEYLVTERNFDAVPSPPTQIQYSPYVNNILYSYVIFEDCQGAPIQSLAVPYTVDPLADTYSPVASFLGGEIALNTSSGVELTAAPGIFSYGSYYTSLTRDDVAGLRLLMGSNTRNWEVPAPQSELITATTNLLSPQLFPVSVATNGVLFNGIFYGTGDLGGLLSSARTNPPSVLTNLYPGLIVATSTNYFTVVAVTNVTAFFTNYIGATFGSPPTLVLATNITFVPMTIFADTFANVVTNHIHSNTVAQLLTITVAPLVGSPAGSPSVTTTKTKTVILTNVPSGDFYILPTNSPCGLDIASTLMTNVIVTTNLLFSSNGTNSVVTTGTTNTTGSFFSESLVTRLTNYVFTINPVSCTQTGAATNLYEGIEKIDFVKSSYDSLVGQTFQAITNDYTMYEVTNFQVQLDHFQRIVTQPDILLSAADLVVNDPGPAVQEYSRNVTWSQDTELPGSGPAAGPGTILTPSTISFEKVGPIYINGILFGVMDGTSFFTQTPGGDQNDSFYGAYYVWGSFDGTTNAPVVYPNGTGIAGLENQILIQISPSTVPNGFDNVVYPSVTFTTSGGSLLPPYTWSAQNLPPGMDVSPSGTLEGTPTLSGTNVFTLILTDSLNRTVQWNYTLLIQ